MDKTKKILVGFGVTFIGVLIFFSNNPEEYIKSIRLGYSGKLIKKYFLKADHFVIKTNDSELDVVMLSHELSNNIEIGDSIIKIPNDNYCIIIKPDKTTRKYLYKYIPKDVRNDFRWPKEWEDKWLEAN